MSVAPVASICCAVTMLIVCGISTIGVSVFVPVVLRRATRPTLASRSAPADTEIAGNVPPAAVSPFT